MSSCYFFFSNWGYASFTELVGSILLFTLPEKFDNIKMIYSLGKLRTFPQRGFVFISTEGRGTIPGCSGAWASLSVAVFNQHFYLRAALLFSLFTVHSRCLLCFQLVVSVLKILTTSISFFVCVCTRKNMCICYSWILHLVKGSLRMSTLP